MSKRLVLSACVVCCQLTLSMARGDEGGFKLSKLNPFGARGDEQENPADEPPRERLASRTTPERPAAKEESGFAWPSLPKWPSFSRNGSSEHERTMEYDEHSSSDTPSTWEKVSTGTKQFFSKTKQTLMPWTADKDAKGSVSSAKRRPTRMTSRSRAKSERKSFFSSFWNTEEEDPVQTTGDFLALPRVPY